MDPGALNKSVTLQALADGQDAIGQPVTTWAPVATVRANIRYASGVEVIRAGAQSAVTQASVRIRKRPGVTSAMRLKFGDQYLAIRSVLPDQNLMYLNLVCEEINVRS
jgi:SPP1 family predicted phage head-tail adaptor